MLLADIFKRREDFREKFDFHNLKSWVNLRFDG